MDSFPPRWDRVVLGGLSLQNISLASAVAGAVTVNADAGIVTSETLSTPPNGDYLLTMTNSSIAPNDMVLATVRRGTSTNGRPRIEEVEPGAGQVVIRVSNAVGAGSLNGTIRIVFFVVKTP